MKQKREVRLQPRPDKFVGGKWSYIMRPIVRLGSVGVWSMVRHADHPSALPFVVSNRDWAKFEVQIDADSVSRVD